MWILFAFASAFFAGVTAILAKCGIRTTDSDVATAIRTVVVLAFAWMMAYIVGSVDTIRDIDGRQWTFLVLSGLSTGASWLFYFKALQKGNINVVVPIDKCSIVLTVILAFVLLGEDVDASGLIGLAAIAAGTLMMVERKNVVQDAQGRIWLLQAVLSAVFASLTSIFAKIGMTGIDSNLGTAIRTAIVLVMSFIVVLLRRKGSKLRSIPGRELFFIVLSGLATGASWLCYYKALQDGKASLVVPIDKLSIVFTVVFSYIVFKERLSRRAFLGLVLVVAGTIGMLF